MMIPEPRRIYLPCNAVAEFDIPSEIGYRCTSCFAMLGSMGQPRQCVKAAEKWKALEALGGQGWYYIKGGQKKAKECQPNKF
jgi:hypothetical protein